jgi:hypothetical protein
LSPNAIRFKSRRIKWAGHIIHKREIKNACNILVENPEEKRPLAILWSRHSGCKNV